MTIRAATSHDLNALYQLWCELMEQHQAYHPIFGYHPTADTELRQTLLGRLRETYTRFFIAESPTELIGLLVATYQIGTNGMHFSRRGYIAETIVRETHRRQGIGQALFEHAKTWLALQGADHLELQVAVSNPEGLRFWSSRGFVPTTQHLVLPLLGNTDSLRSGQ